jgi:ACS family glucarate transporter-like MFS transporter
LAAGIGWYFLARDKPEEHAWVGREELEHIRAGLPPSIAGEQFSWKAIFRNKNVLIITLSYFCYGYVAYIFFTWFFIYLSNVRGLDLKSSSYYGMLPFIAMAIASPLGGWVSDVLARRIGKRAARCGIAAASIALSAVFLVLGPVAHDARVASLVLAGGAGALYLSQSAFWSVTSDIAGKSAGSVSGVMNMGNQMGGVVTASLTPFLAKHFGWGVPFFVAAGLSVVGALAWLAVDPDNTLARD